MDFAKQIEYNRRLLVEDIFRRLEAALQPLVDAVNDFFAVLFSRRLPTDWREQWHALIAEQEAAGYRVEPQSVREFEDWIEAWARYCELLPITESHAVSAAPDANDLLVPNLTTTQTVPRYRNGRIVGGMGGDVTVPGQSLSDAWFEMTAPTRADYRNLSTQGYGPISAGIVTAGATAARIIGVESLENAREGRDAAGNRLSTSQRIVEGVIGGAGVISTAIGLAPIARAGAVGISQVFATARSALGAEFGTFASGRTVAQDLAEAAGRARQTIGAGKSAVYGTKVHAAFEAEVRGIGNANLATEQSYLNGRLVSRGTPGSVRVDVVEGPVTAPTKIYDLKTGGAKLSSSRIDQIQQHVPGGSSVPVIEVR